METINWTEIIIRICAILITGVLIPLINSKWKESKAKLSKEQQYTVNYWVDVAVRYAKQWMQSESGEKKKAEVMVYVSDKLTELGIDVSAADLDKIIEAVYEKVKKEAAKEAV